MFAQHVVHQEFDGRRRHQAGGSVQNHQQHSEQQEAAARANQFQQQRKRATQLLGFRLFRFRRRHRFAFSSEYIVERGAGSAAAEVSGIVALLLQRNPSLTPSEVRRILMSTATDLGPKGRDRDFGAGLVDALKALRLVKPASGT